MRKTIFVFLSIFVLTSLACGWFAPKSQPNDSWPTPVVSTQEAQQLQDNVKAANDQLATSDQLDLVITESQLTSFLVTQLADQGITSLESPQIYLRDGKVQVYATYVEAGTSVDLAVVLSFSANQGKVVVTLESVKIAGFTAPTALVNKAQDAIRTQVEPSLNQWLAETMYIESVAVADGNLTLHARKP